MKEIIYFKIYKNKHYELISRKKKGIFYYKILRYILYIT